MSDAESSRIAAEVADLEDEVSSPAGVAYQIVGALASVAGLFDHPEVQRALDYLSGRPIEGDILPWPRDGMDALSATLARLEAEKAALVAAGDEMAAVMHEAMRRCVALKPMIRHRAIRAAQKWDALRQARGEAE